MVEQSTCKEIQKNSVTIPTSPILALKRTLQVPMVVLSTGIKVLIMVLLRM